MNRAHCLLCNLIDLSAGQIYSVSLASQSEKSLITTSKKCIKLGLVSTSIQALYKSLSYNIKNYVWIIPGVILNESTLSGFKVKGSVSLDQ